MGLYYLGCIYDIDGARDQEIFKGNRNNSGNIIGMDSEKYCPTRQNYLFVGLVSGIPKLIHYRVVLFHNPDSGLTDP